ncbi:hypothetical protein FUA23_10690 [Neolewinella aurantiaca]|uniref:Uncharacterized protein n=1 Tax=Neolewinella aurantiaca TaxID=2602767 RepID=A0A5C7FT20_9BACT|nr:hypothetical protein [Neolewinella aurantiaca]TXF89425.1 hypothetical protein FUA23_10690 [Neolewinella aurantiaca]
MPIHRLTAILFVYTLMHCSGPASAIPLSDLDYIEIENHTGWVLRIHGDGGGSLSHKQLPAHYLHYPAQTFSPTPGRQIALRCRGRSLSPVCVLVSYYDASVNSVSVCRCSPGGWPGAIMEQAISQMQYAVDAGGSERSCRMLMRKWIASR